MTDLLTRVGPETEASGWKNLGLPSGPIIYAMVSYFPLNERMYLILLRWKFFFIGDKRTRYLLLLVQGICSMWKEIFLVLDRLQTLWGLHWRLQPFMAYHVQPYFGLWNPRPSFHCGKRDVILRKPKSRIIPRARNNSFAISSICQSFIKAHFQFRVSHYMEKRNTKRIDMLEDGACQMALALSWQLRVLRSLRGTEVIRRLCILHTTLILVTSVCWSVVRHETWSEPTYVTN